MPSFSIRTLNLQRQIFTLLFQGNKALTLNLKGSFIPLHRESKLSLRETEQFQFEQVRFDKKLNICSILKTSRFIPSPPLIVNRLIIATFKLLFEMNNNNG